MCYFNKILRPWSKIFVFYIKANGNILEINYFIKSRALINHFFFFYLQLQLPTFLILQAHLLLFTLIKRKT